MNLLQKLWQKNHLLLNQKDHKLKQSLKVCNMIMDRIGKENRRKKRTRI